jgi:uncharacterized protein YceK
MRGFFMSMSKICPALMISVGLLLGGCTSIKQYLSPTETSAADAEQAEAAAPEAEEAVASEVVVEAPLLVYEWDTEFSTFLSPPIEVRRQAKADCVSGGYEVAVVETLVLDGNVATAHFICRGDFE